ncbi:hypothetical protein [Paenibacillus odorifer]|uniref:hypothetical protein n=1 Tax=Paenibacillus odorifer TaxID=189426 RepID=UPI0015C3F0F2|nr:hypothetical protein [Paenibacillus odorifer]
MNAQRSKLAKVKRTKQQTSKPANQQKGLITKQQTHKRAKTNQLANKATNPTS